MKTNRTEVLYVRITPEFQKEIEDAAEDMNMTVSNFTIYCITKELKANAKEA